MTKKQLFIATVAAAALLSFLPVRSQAAGPGSTTDNPDLTRGDPIPKGATHDWNLGPTGARGWIYSNKLETSEARQIYVAKVEEGSPADGVLLRGDVILGIAGRPFAYDPRTELGKAIGAAEATDGALSLIRWRECNTTKAVLQLPVMGSYARTAPFDCPKSKRIFEQGCEALARKMKANPDEGNRITRSLNALALLSSGRLDYLPLVREQVQWASQYSDPERRLLHSWFYGPVNILLAEYILATGDRSFMPDLLTMLADHDVKADPRGMQQRYLCFALFNQRGGMLGRSLDGVDRPLLYAAVKAGLRNEDGRARGSIGSVYRNLSYEEVEPLLPTIYRAVIEPAPSGIMFADGIRLRGLEILAKHHIKEGVSLCLDVMEIQRWGKRDRITKCLEILQTFGGAARPTLPGLAQLEEQLLAHREAKGLQPQIDLVRQTMAAIETDKHPPVLRSLSGGR